MIKNQHIKNRKIKEWQENIEPELLNNFITYWSLRKSNFLTSDNTIKQMKTTKSGAWFNLIEANHKFRELYGDDLANELIKTIEEDEQAN